MLVGIGSALAALGAFLALTVALAPPPDVDVVGKPEHHRRERNATVTTIFAAVTGFTGAALLITSAWPWSFVAIGDAVVLYLACMVISTYRDQRLVLKWIRFERDTDRDASGRPGRITASMAAWMKFAPDDVIDGPPMRYGAAEDPKSIDFADRVEAIVEERARLSWAVRHPFGAGLTLREMLRSWIVLLRYRLETRR